MAALTYVLPPLSGAVGFFFGRSVRVRFHGLQSVVFGVVWPLALYAASWLSPGTTQVVFALGAVAWFAAIVLTALGLDPHLPGSRHMLEQACAVRPGARDEA